MCRCLVVEEEECSQCRVRTSVIVRRPLQAEHPSPSPAPPSASSCGSAASEEGEQWQARSTLVDAWVAEHDFPGHPEPPDHLEAGELSNHDDVIERGKTMGQQYAREVSSALEVDRGKGRLEGHIAQRVDLEGNTSYTCTVCCRDFTHRSNVRYHASCAGGPAGSYPCELCNKLFKSSSHLTYHMRSVHTKERPFRCSRCDKSFHQSVKLKRHMLQHTGERPFECDICKKSFKTNYHLKEHRNIHTTELHHPCSTCDKRFADKNNLRRHQKIYHSPNKFTCELSTCKMELVSKHEYELHIKDHRSELVYSFICKFCEKGFKNKTDLERHERTHQVRRQFICDLCHQQFSRRDHLKRHQRRHARPPLVQELRERVDEEAEDQPAAHTTDHPAIQRVDPGAQLADPGIPQSRFQMLDPGSQIADTGIQIMNPLLQTDDSSLHADDPAIQLADPGIQMMDWEPARPVLHVPELVLARAPGRAPSPPAGPPSPSPTCRARVQGEIMDLLRGITRAELRAVMGRVDPAEREALDRILRSANISATAIKTTEEAKETEPRPATTNLKKNILNRYRKQSGYCDTSSKSEMTALTDGMAAFEMPELEVAASQREAAARALAEWWEEKVRRGGQLRERAGGAAGTGARANTVIKVTPEGLRKMTFFEGDFKH